MPPLYVTSHVDDYHSIRAVVDFAFTVDDGLNEPAQLDAQLHLHAAITKRVIATSAAHHEQIGCGSAQNPDEFLTLHKILGR